MVKRKKISCDIDGILNTYPQCWLDYLAEKCGVRYQSVPEAKTRESKYRMFKDEYRNSDYKAHLPMIQHNRDVINRMACSGHDIVMVTSRPILESSYPNLFKNTKQWLEDNGVNFCNFDYKDKNAKFLDKYEGVDFHIDDDPAYAGKVAEKGYKVFLLRNDNWDFSQMSGSGNIIIINDLNEIFSYETIL